MTTWNEAHLKGGSFDQERMMAALDEMIRDARRHRPSADAARRADGLGVLVSAGIEQLVAYEASVNEVLNRGKTPTVCVYDVRRLSGSMMMDLLRAHPLTVMNGVLHENPFYTPAEEMLRDLQNRRALADMRWLLRHRTARATTRGGCDGASAIWRRSTRCRRCASDARRTRRSTIVLDALPTALELRSASTSLAGLAAERARLASRDASSRDEAAGRGQAAVSPPDARWRRTQVILGDGQVLVSRGRVPARRRARAASWRARRRRSIPRPIACWCAAPRTSSARRSRPRSVLEAARRKDDFLAMLGPRAAQPARADPDRRRAARAARRRRARAAVIERHTRHLARLVDDLLDISRVTRGHVELRSESVALTSVLERAVEIAAPLSRASATRWRVGERRRLTLRGDPGAAGASFGNLLTNAAKFTPARRPHRRLVDARRARARHRARQRARHRARSARRIFEPFVQADRERDALRGGLGLGLAIVHNLVERHGGTITVDSDGPGHGAAFTVELADRGRRAAPASSRPAAAAGARARRAGPRGRRQRRHRGAALRGPAARGLPDRRRARRARGDRTWRTFAPHAAVLDVGLPDVDGYELAARCAPNMARSRR